MALLDQSLPNVRAISPYQPGKPITQLAREMGIPVERIVKRVTDAADHYDDALVAQFGGFRGDR